MPSSTSAPVDLNGVGSVTGGCSSCASGAENMATCAQEASTQTCNSVLLNSGQFKFDLPLLSISSLGGVGWSFALNYLAGNNVDDVLGLGFNFPQRMVLEEDTNFVELLPGNNTSERFDEVSPNVYEPAADNNTMSTLTRNGSGMASDEFTMTSAMGVVTKFFGFHASITAPGSLKSITDRYGSTQTYDWTSNGGVVQLSTVTDSYGRSISYRYYGSEKGYRLQEIEDFLNRKLNFQYDDDGHLVAVITPSIERAAEGNTFPGGTAYVFQYDVDNTDPLRQDDLIRIWYPNETLPYLDPDDRSVDVDQVIANATPRYFVEYGQDSGDADTYGRVVKETVGDPANDIGGTYEFAYTTSGLPSNPFADTVNDMVFRCTVTDRNGNEKIDDFNAQRMPVRVEVKRNRDKINIPTTTAFPSYITWTQYNENSQVLTQVFPEGNSVESEYEDGVIPGITGIYAKRKGLLLRTTRLPGNSIGIASRSGSNGQAELTQRMFYEPIFNQPTATIEQRGNPIDGSGTYFTPQNGGTTPTNADRSRYATITFCDYQQNEVDTVKNDTNLQAALGLTAAEIQSLIDFVDGQMKATDGSGGLPDGFQLDLGDINGDGTGDGASSGLTAARQKGTTVKVRHPDVRLIGSAAITTQVREEIFTNNDRGQQTTHTDPEGNLSLVVRYPDNDPEGDGQFIATGLSSKQYGRAKETRTDADPNDVMSLIGADGDLADFIPGKITRTNTPGVYQNLITRYEGSKIGSGGGCAACAYDPLGNPLAVTDARGFTTRYERNEMGEAFRTISPDPYRYRTETYYDANRNVTRVDTEDKYVQFVSEDPGDRCFAQMNPSGSGFVAQVPTQAGVGGTIRPGWFTDLMSYDLLNNLIEQNADATGSYPDRLITTHEYDANQNRIKTIKPEGNTVEIDYDERNLQIAQWIGGDGSTFTTGAIAVTAFDGNGNVMQAIGPAQRGGSGNHQTVTIEDPFGETGPLVHTGDFIVENTYDGFDRVITAKDAVGNVADMDGTLSEPCYDPGGRSIKSTSQGPIGGATPTDRNGTNNVDLTETLSRYDEAGRSYENQQEVFVASATLLSSSRDIDHTGGGLEADSVSNGHTAAVQLVTAGSATSNRTYVLRRDVYDRASRVAETVADNTGTSVAVYDGADRRIKTVDASGNVIDVTYDNNSNIVLVIATEKCTITLPAVSDEIFRVASRYDCLNRLVISAVQGADGMLDLEMLTCNSTAIWQVATSTFFTLQGYDSRNNNTLSIDPKGNSSIAVFDGANRTIQSQQQLREKGQGAAPPAAGQTFMPFSEGTITTLTDYDGNGRVTRLVDDNGNQTLYAFDTLDREVQMTFMDGSTRDYQYNTASNLTQYTDENGSISTNTFDGLGRKTLCDIARASGVIGTNQQNFQYDGLSRLTFCRDSIGAINADVSLFYDSLSRVLEDSQSFAGNTHNATNEQFESHPVTRFAFPDGRQINNAYDLLYRRTLIEETTGGAVISAWEFFGPGRVAELTLGNGLICSHMNNARNRSAIQEHQSSPDWGDQSTDRLGYDGAGRIITKRWLIGGIDGTTHSYNDTTALVGQTTAYDKASNKLYERALQAESRSSLYEFFDADNRPAGGYDSLDRLRQYQRGVLSSTGGCGNAGGGSVTTPISLPGTDENRDYDLDGLGNWKNTTFEPVGEDQETQIRQHNSLNQLTSIQDEAETKEALAYDVDGNLLVDPERIYEWDALNRLKIVKRRSDGLTIGEYAYDAINRRIQKIISNGGVSGNISNGTTGFYYHSGISQCCEESNGSNSVTKQYIWGGYIDELIQQMQTVTINNNVAGDYYPLSDTLYRTMALSNSAGSIVEAYDADAYGKTLVFTGTGTGDVWWTDDATQSENATCEFIFTGRRFDTETKLQFYRKRYYVPELSRFASRDPLEYFESLNLYSYVDANPLINLDPFGEAKHHWFLQLGDRGVGQTRVNQICFGDSSFNIHDFTTDVGKWHKPTCPSDKAGPHYWLHHVFQYDSKYLAILEAAGASKNCCAFLTAVDALRRAAIAGMIADGITPTRVDLHKYRSPQTNTDAQFASLIAIACKKKKPPEPPTVIPIILAGVRKGAAVTGSTVVKHGPTVASKAASLATISTASLTTAASFLFCLTCSLNNMYHRDSQGGMIASRESDIGRG